MLTFGFKPQMQEARAAARRVPATGIYAKDSLNTSEIIAEILRMSDVRTGGIATYFGMTKSPGFAHKGVKELIIKTDPALSTKGLRSLCADVKKKFHLQLAVIYHYEGRFKPGELLVMIVVAANSRPEAFAAMDEIIHRFKKEGVLRKKEIFEHGESEWVEGDTVYSVDGQTPQH